MTQIRVDLDQCGVFHWWWLIFWGYLYCFSLRFTNSCVFLLFLFQNSLRFINRAFARGIWTVIATTHQKSTKYISKPVSSYFLASPYARLGWFVLFFSNLPPNFWKIWVPTKILFFGYSLEVSYQNLFFGYSLEVSVVHIVWVAYTDRQELWVNI